MARSLPETAPSYVVLAQVLQLGSLHNELVHLVDDVQLFVVLKVTSCKLLRDAIKHLDGPSILALHFLGTIDQVSVRSCGAVRTRAGPSCRQYDRLGSVEELRGCDVTFQDGLASRSWGARSSQRCLTVRPKGWSSRRCSVGQTPCQEWIMDELHTISWLNDKTILGNLPLPKRP